MSLKHNLSVEADSPSKKVRLNIIIPKTTSLSEITLNIKDEEEPTVFTEKEEQRPESPAMQSDNENWDNPIEPEILLATLEGDANEDQRKSLENEKYCLVSETTYLLAKGSKTLCIGVRPTDFFKPVVRISNPQLTAGIFLEREEFKEFCAKLNPIAAKGNVETTDDLVGFKNYNLIKENKDFQFKPKQKAKGLRPLTLGLDAVVDILNKENMVLNTLEGLKDRTKDGHEEYTKFILDVALYVKDHGYNDFNNNVFNIIKQKHRCSPILFEIASKLPCTLRKDVENQVTSFAKLLLSS